ncbi:MAG: hypothetical protein WEF86_12215 [Gemmatimonadota bacterium]
MKEKLALRVLGDIMGWSDERATQEFRWLSLMSRLKYDGYHDFLAGVRFIESLANWMQQFEPTDRECAYAFVRSALVYIGPAEMLRLVESFYPEHVQRRLARAVAQRHGVSPYRVWAQEKTAGAYDNLLRQTLFIGLSEGARLDLFRRANARTIRNEQVLLATYVNEEKWRKLREELASDLGVATDDQRAKFQCVYLIDDFVASGTTFIRKDAEDGPWKGKLAGFRDTIANVRESHFESDLTVCVHHHVATHRAVGVLEERQRQALDEEGAAQWFTNVEFSYGTILPADLPIDESALDEARDFVDLAQRYFDPDDPSTRNKHIEKGGTSAELGFAGCALPLVLEHNTPNNSVALLWADTPGNDGGNDEPERHAMRPLFRRRQRHS